MGRIVIKTSFLNLVGIGYQYSKFKQLKNLIYKLVKSNIKCFNKSIVTCLDS